MCNTQTHYVSLPFHPQPSHYSTSYLTGTSFEIHSSHPSKLGLKAALPQTNPQLIRSRTARKAYGNATEWSPQGMWQWQPRNQNANKIQSIQTERNKRSKNNCQTSMYCLNKSNHHFNFLPSKSFFVKLFQSLCIHPFKLHDHACAILQTESGTVSLYIIHMDRQVDGQVSSTCTCKSYPSSHPLKQKKQVTIFIDYSRSSCIQTRLLTVYILVSFLLPVLFCSSPICLMSFSAFSCFLPSNAICAI